MVYRATAQRAGEEPFEAIMTSVYVRSADGPRLALYAQDEQRTDLTLTESKFEPYTASLALPGGLRRCPIQCHRHLVTLVAR